jgi:hypothetical protein
MFDVGASVSARRQSEAGLRSPSRTGSGAAGREGADPFEPFLEGVDFPEFVSDLINGVFESVVGASLRQMDAHAMLLESVNQFAKDDFTRDQGRDRLANRFPTGSQRSLGMVRSSDPDWHVAGRRRPRTLATMVLIGINWMVATGGLIDPEVLIEVKTGATAAPTSHAYSFDGKDARAELAGEVEIQFRSDCFPLERLAPHTGLASSDRNASGAGAPMPRPGTSGDAT